MGHMVQLQCSTCKKKYLVQLGIGARYAAQYEQTMDEIRIGKYGEEWQKLINSDPSLCVDITQKLFVCNACGCWKVDKNLTVYQSKDGPEQKESHNKGFLPENRTGYKLFKNYLHKCPNCGKRMKGYDDIAPDIQGKLICRECPGFLEGTACLIKWD